MTTNARPTPAVKRVGIFDADAPEGYVALVVYGFNGRRLLRLEIVSEMYSPAWVSWLERWLKRWSPGFLELVK